MNWNDILFFFYQKTESVKSVFRDLARETELREFCKKIIFVWSGKKKSFFRNVCKLYLDVVPSNPELVTSRATGRSSCPRCNNNNNKEKDLLLPSFEFKTTWHQLTYFSWFLNGAHHQFCMFFFFFFLNNEFSNPSESWRLNFVVRSLRSHFTSLVFHENVKLSFDISRLLPYFI